MKNFLHKLLGSLNTSTEGFSARKLSACVIVACVIAAHIKWMAKGDFQQLELVLTIDYSFITACLGMTTYETVTKIREKNEANKDTSPSNNIS